MASKSVACELSKKVRSYIELAWAARIVIVDVVIATVYFICYCHIAIYAQYCYYRFGLDALRNTSFVPPNGTFCMKSQMINNYSESSDAYVKDEKLSNYLNVYGQIAEKIPEILATLIIGPLTDKYGRKIGMILPQLGIVVDGIVALVIIRLNISPYFFILSHCLSGLFGGIPLLASSVFSYIADVSSPKWRTLRLGIIIAVKAFGGGAGELLVGYWLDASNCDFFALFCFYTGIAACLLVYICIIPDSLPKSERKKVSDENPKGLKVFFEGAKLYCGGLSLRKTWKLYVATLVIAVVCANAISVHYIDIYFLKAMPFDFSPHEIGIYQVLRESSRGMASVVILTVLTVLKVNDIIIMLLAVAGHVVCSILIGFSTQVWQLYLIVSFKGVELLAHSGAQGYLSKLVDPKNQGALFSILSSLSTVSSMLANIFWPLVFPLTLELHLRSGTSYVMMGTGAIVLLPLLLSLLFLKKEEEEAINEEDKDQKLANGNYRLRHKNGTIKNVNEETKPFLTNHHDSN